MVTAQWRSLKNEERLRLKKLLGLNGKNLMLSNFIYNYYIYR
jgi:hypothetical protein